MSHSKSNRSAAAPAAPPHAGNRKAVRMTVSKEDYLKAIAEAESEGDAVIAATLARWLSISPPAVTAGLQRLRRDGLVRKEQGGRLLLTHQGRAIAEKIRVRHNLIERMLNEVFGMEWYKVHDEAERLEHAVSQEFEERLNKVLGEGKPCPHGNHVVLDAVADRRKRGWHRLSEVAEGGHFAVAAVDERDRQFLEFLDSVGLRPGQTFTWESRNYDDTLSLALDGQHCRIGITAAERIWVRSAPAPRTRSTR